MGVKRSAELERLAAEARQKGIEGDDAWFEARLADGDVISIGTAPDEIWRGRDEVLSLNTARVKAMNEEAGIEDFATAQPAADVEAYEIGDTGVIVTSTSFVLNDGSTVPFRAITVLSRVNGEWKYVLGASHVVADNELINPGSPLAKRA